MFVETTTSFGRSALLWQFKQNLRLNGLGFCIAHWRRCRLLCYFARWHEVLYAVPSSPHLPAPAAPTNASATASSNCPPPHLRQRHGYTILLKLRSSCDF